MSTIIDKVNSLRADQRFISFEFFPPKTDAGFRNLLARLHRMLALNPLFITVTWGAGGSTSEKTLDLAATCLRDLGLTTVLHLTCTNTNKEIIDNALEKAKANGIRNILALRGDPPRTQEYWTPNCEFNAAADLVRYIKAKHGDYFCIGVAGYPEGHVQGADESNQDPKNDMPYLIEKIDAGADFIITQLFYDVDKFISYEKLLRQYPQLKDKVIIPGLMPITTFNVFTRASKLSHAHIPADIYETLEAHSNNDDFIKNLGVEILSNIVTTIDEKTNGRIKGYHFYCLNLEKAVASLVNYNKILREVIKGTPERKINDVAIESDSESEDDISTEQIPAKRRRSSKINDNDTIHDLDGVVTAQKNLISKTLLGDKNVLVEISTGKGALGKDATWDDFPNGRFGDSTSPAYGEIDGYGPTLKINTPKEAEKIWGTPETVSDVIKIFIDYLSGKINKLPWTDTPLSAETSLIQEELFELNKKSWFSLASQPAVDGCKSSDKIFGWGPANGIIYQKAFVELFVPKTQWKNELYPMLKKYFDDLTMTYYTGDSNGEIESNLKPKEGGQAIKNAITWGVFSLKEVLQPTIIDLESFKAWNEEAFHLWLEWSRCYKKDSKSFKLLNSIHSDYYLVSLIHHDFKDEHGLWDILLAKK